MSKENQRRFILLLSAYINRDNCTKRFILDFIYDNNWLVLSEHDLQLNPKIKEPFWRNELAFVRKHLVSDGYFDDNEKNQWLIQKSGIEYLDFLFEQLKLSEHSLLTDKAMKDAEKILQDILLSDFYIQGSKKEKIKIIPTKVEREAIVKQRIGQGSFRNDILERSHVCQICGLSNESLLRASHIKPWSVSNREEKLDIDNGLLLCVLHDGLFDKGLISFSPAGKIMISDSLIRLDREILGINNSLEITIEDTQRNYIQYHREHVFQR